MSQAPPPPPPPPHQPPPPPPPRESANALDAIIPTNPLAAVSCYMGIVSVILCCAGPVLGPGAIVFGVLGLKKWKVQETDYGATTSKIRAWVGIVSGILGTLIGIPVLIMMIMNMLEG